MKNLLKSLLLFLSTFGFISEASCQWRSPGMNPWTGDDPEILKSSPNFKIAGLSSVAALSLHNNTNQFRGALFTTGSLGIGLGTGLNLPGTYYRHDLTLDTMGYVGLGTSMPTARLTIENGGLDLNDDTLPTMRFQIGGVNEGLIRLGNEFLIQSLNRNIRLATDTGRIAFETIDTARLVILKNGNVGIGTTSPNSTLEVHGDICITGLYKGVSDMRLKKNIARVKNARVMINKLNPVSYKFRTDDYPHLNLPSNSRFGLIAQEVEKVLPFLVDESELANVLDNEDNFKHVSYIELIPLLLRAIQELDQELQELRQN